MVDPKQVTNFNRTDDELFEFALFCLMVVGKNSDVQARKLEEFLSKGRPYSPQIYMWVLAFGGNLVEALQEVKVGQYKRLAFAILRLVLLDVRRATLDQLESVMGRKTSRFFLLHSRAGFESAALDTHILRWMGDVTGRVLPKATPTSTKKYRALEQDFLKLAKLHFPEMSTADADLHIWKLYSGRS